MSVKKITFLLCLMALTFIRATPFPFVYSFASASTTSVLTCNVDAPENLHVTETGSTFFNLAWDSEPLALGGYRIRAFRTSDSALINTKFTPNAAANSIIMDGLVMGEEYKLVINSICEGGENSFLEAKIGPLSTLILDLVVIGYNPPNYGDYCQLVSSGTCTFDHTPNLVTGFKIRNGTDSRLFGVRPIKDDAMNLHFKIELDQDNSSENLKYKIRCEVNGSQTSEPDCSTDWYKIFRIRSGVGETAIAKFNLTDFSSNGQLNYVVLSAGDTLTRLRPESGTRPTPSRTPVRLRDETSANFRNVFVSPNPFSDVLNVFLGNSTAESIHLQIYNFSGQKVLDQQFAGRQEQYSLSSANLPPGFYLLRIEADGEVQALKVVKSD